MVMTAQEILKDFGRLKDVADLLGVSVQAVQNMKTRKKIPPRHWPRLVAAARTKGIKQITIETLANSYAGHA